MTAATPAPRRFRWPLAYAMTTVVFLAMDAVWLSLSNAPLYRPAMGHLMAPTVDWLAVAIFYPLYVAGLLFFAVQPAWGAQRLAVALGRGAFLGLLAYAAYDLTNQATLRDWPWHLTLIDLAWGSTVSGVSSWAAAWGSLLTTSRPARPVPGR